MLTSASRFVEFYDAATQRWKEWEDGPVSQPTEEYVNPKMQAIFDYLSSLSEPV